MRQLGQLSDDVDSWFSWGRVTGTPGQKFTSPINGKEYLIKNPSDLGPEELAQLRQVLSEGKSGKLVAEQSVKNFDFHTDDGIAIEFKSVSSNDLQTAVRNIQDGFKKFEVQNIPIKNSLVEVDFTYEGMKAGQYVKPSSIGISEIQQIIDEIRIYNPPYYPVRFKYLENGVIKFYEYIP